MKVFGTTEAAAEIGCEPRALRKFLRENDSWRNAGVGGRYHFSEAEMASLKRQFNAAMKKSRPTAHGQRIAEESEALNVDPGVDVSLLGPRGLPPHVRRDRVGARQERRQRLRARMDEVLEERYDDEPAGI